MTRHVLPIVALVTLSLLSGEARADNEANFCTFNGAGSYVTLNGSASIVSNQLQLVSGATNQAGSAFLTSPLSITNTTSFHTHFRMVIGSGGEGMTFVVRGAGSGSLGSNGAGLGYVGITSSVAVEFDTNKDSGESDANHIAVQTNGSGTDTASVTSGVPTMNGATIDAWVDYDAAGKTLKVYAATTSTKPASPFVSTTYDLTGVGSTAYVGFTSSTASSVKAAETVTYWVFTTGSTLIECTSCTSQPTCNSQTYYPVCDTTRQQCVPCSSDNGGAAPACPSASTPACQKSGTLVGQCTACSSTNAALCSGTTPECDVSSGTCGACNGDFGQSASRACNTSAKPACFGNGSCVACSASILTNCTGTTPTCNTSNGSCVSCNGDNGSANTQPCTTAALPACLGTGACAQCSPTHLNLCTGNVPTCDGNGSCAACNDDHGGTGSRPCPSAVTPACQASGACAQCSATDLALCTGQSPTCNAGSCAPCNADLGDPSGQTCPNAASPYCFLSGGQVGACGKCTQSSDCVGHTAGTVCNTTTGSCGTSCSVDANCAADRWCANNVCTPKTPNGQPVPAGAGACSPAVGLRVCLSGACSTADDTCGLPNGATCADPFGDAGVDGGSDAAAPDAGSDAGSPPTPADLTCRSGHCDADGKCGKPYGESCGQNAQCRSAKCDIGMCVECTTDSDCGGGTSGKVCDDTTRKCVDGCRGAQGNGCPPGQVCSSLSVSVGTCATPGSDGGTTDAGQESDGGPVADGGAAVDGSFVDGAVLGEDGELRGGAFTCASTPGATGASALFGLAPFAALFALSVRRRRRR